MLLWKCNDGPLIAVHVPGPCRSTSPAVSSPRSLLRPSPRSRGYPVQVVDTLLQIVCEVKPELHVNFVK